MEYLKEEKVISKKILFTGLDDAGKTSIILALQREFSKIANIQPTRGAQRRIFQFLGKEISEWDLGGQTTYRISYLKNPDKFFAGTEIAIYVIDVINKERLSESLSYLKDVILQFKKLHITPPINIFFHKFDPTLPKSTREELGTLTLNLKKKINDLVRYKKIYFFETSIYSLPSIMNAISEILLELYPRSKLIKKTIEEFAIKLNCEGIVIIDKNSLIIGSYFKDHETGEILTRSMPYFLTLNDSFQLEGVDQTNQDQMVVHRFGKFFLFKEILLKESGTPYYLLIVKGDNPWDLYFSNKDFRAFIHMLRDLIYK
ncbi:MAG: ADP-ribosylation factor-like protein [Promethearchaeota archaeon]